MIGDGKLGQLVAQTLAIEGCELWVIGRHASKLALLAQRGIRTGLQAEMPERYFDIAVKYTGNPSGFETARQGLKPRGVLVLKSTYADRLSLDVSSIVVDEITLMGSRCGPSAKALSVLANRQVDVAPLIQARYPLSEGLAAFEQAQKKGTLKVLLEVASV